jgi:hypothetical protein
LSRGLKNLGLFEVRAPSTRPSFSEYHLQETIELAGRGQLVEKLGSENNITVTVAKAILASDPEGGG